MRMYGFVTTSIKQIEPYFYCNASEIQKKRKKKKKEGGDIRSLRSSTPILNFFFPHKEKLEPLSVFLRFPFNSVLGIISHQTEMEKTKTQPSLIQRNLTGILNLPVKNLVLLNTPLLCNPALHFSGPLKDGIFDQINSMPQGQNIEN